MPSEIFSHAARTPSTRFFAASNTIDSPHLAGSLTHVSWPQSTTRKHYVVANDGGDAPIEQR